MSNLRANFTRRENGCIYVEISNLSSKDVYVAKATPERIAQFAEEYAAFEAGQGSALRPGTPLTDVPGIDQTIARNYRLKDVHNAEELAALTDAACQAMGLGVLTARKAAQHLLAAQRAEAMEAMMPVKRGPGRPRKVVVANPEGELA